MPNDYSKIPESLRSRHQFCVRVEKQPFIKGKKGYVSRGWSKNKDKWLTFEDALAAIDKKELVIFQDKPRQVEALGFLMNRETGAPRPVLIGGDIDCCRDPETGELSQWSNDFLMKVLPFYTEVSPSKCGIRFFLIGGIGRDKLTGEGSQNDLSAETKSRIFAAKPSAFAKFNTGEPVFNTLELYESGRHLSLTGDVIEDLCFPQEDRTEPLVKAISQWMVKEPISSIDRNNPKMESSLPKIHILDVINTKDFTQSGGQLLGPHPSLGSTTGKNLVVNPELNVYCYMHNGLNTGGDAWVWLACECGAVPWEKAKAGILKDRAALEKTLQYAVTKGLISEEEAKIDLNSTVRKVSLSSHLFETGMYDNGTLVTIEPHPTKSDKKIAKWISDCVIWIDTEIRHDDDTEYIFRGVGARDNREVKFELPAVAIAEPRKFKATVLNAFGGMNRVGELEFEHIQLITKHIKHVMKFSSPRWVDDVPMIPGYETDADVIFKLTSLVPAKVEEGDIDRAKTVLRKLLKIHKYACIVVATSLGAPAVARWYPMERYALGIWGSSGTFKTVTSTYAMGFWGVGYLHGPTLKAGRHGSTINGAMDMFKSAGFLPQPLDNVKAVDKKDMSIYVSLIHSVMEGSEKVRSNKDGGMRDVAAFLSTPIITGEVKPKESSTSARVLGLNWDMSVTEKLTASRMADEVRQLQMDLPIVGYHWIKFLHETDEELGKEFYAYRKAMSENFLKRGFSNSGRLASVFAMVKSIWALLEVSPLGDVFVEHRDEFVKALDSVMTEQGEVVSEETEASRFLTGLQELIASDSSMIHGLNTTSVILGGKPIIGKWTDKGLFIIPGIALDTLTKKGVFDQIPTTDSMTRSLDEIEALVKPNSSYVKYELRINGSKVRGWMIKSELVSKTQDPNDQLVSKI
jgi:hypothetical protein